MPIRAQILVFTWILILPITGIFSFILYDTQKAEYLNGVDDKLMAGAVLARNIIGPEFHDEIVDGDSVSPDAYLSIVRRLNELCLELGYQYLWSNLFLEDGTVVFTAGTSTSKDVSKGDHALFFDVHSDPAAFDPVKRSGTKTYSTFYNEWGEGRMILTPFKDAQGRTYVVGASISIAELSGRLEMTALKSIIIFVGICLLGSGGSLLVAGRISRPLVRLSAVSREIADGNFGLHISDVGGSKEIGNLAASVNSMSEAILANTEERRKLAGAVEQSPNMILIADLDGNIEYVNRRFTELTGYSRSEVIGRNPRLLQSGETPNAVYEELWKTLTTTGIWRGEIKDRKKNGEDFWASMTIFQLKDGNGTPTHLISTHEDVTERKRAEEQTRAAMKQAEAANAAKSRFLAAMSHELRTPLNAILGFADIIANQYLGGIGQKKYLDYARDIQYSGEHLLSLVNDVLDISTIEAGKTALNKEEVAPSELVEDCLSFLAPQVAKKGHTLSVNTGGDLPRLNVDRRALRQVLLNLLSNAVKYTPEGGDIHFSVWASAHGVTFRVQDSGLGIEADRIPSITEPFSRSNQDPHLAVDGWGLGLSISKSLIEKHGGTMEIESEVGVGTIVSVFIPTTDVRSALVG